MKITLAPNGGYNIIEGTADVICNCGTLTEASAVLNYLCMRPLSTAEKSTAQRAIRVWDEARKAKQAARKKPTKEEIKPEPEEEIVVPVLPEI